MPQKNFSPRDLRTDTAKPHLVPVVSPTGLIKQLAVTHTAESPIIRSTFYEDMRSGAVRLVSVEVTETFRGLGWALLVDLYMAEAGGPARWEDYLAHMRYVAECELAGMKPTPFPRELLPAEVLARSAGGGTTAKKFEPKSKPATPAAAADATRRGKGEQP